MNLDPLLNASFAIQLHVATVVPAALIGPYMFAARKGTPTHRFIGKIWFGLMVLSALSSFFIHSVDLFMGFSPIHLLSIFVLYSSFESLQAARQHRIRAHRIGVISMYVGGIVIAGGFTLLPGRIMHDVVLTFPVDWPEPTRLLAFLAMSAASVGLMAAIAFLSRRRSMQAA